MTDEQNEVGQEGPSLQEIKQMRREAPSGWLELSMYESRALLVDAILDTPPSYQFTHSDIAQRAGITDESVRNHIEVLVDLGLVESIGEGKIHEYSVNEDSRVLFEIESLNDSVTEVRSGKPPSFTADEITRRFDSRQSGIHRANFPDKLPAEVTQAAPEQESGGPGVEDIEFLVDQPPRKGTSQAGS